MTHVVLNDANGHVSTFKVDDFINQLHNLLPSLYGVDASAIRTLRHAVMPTEENPVITGQFVEMLVKGYNEAAASKENAPVVDNVVGLGVNEDMGDE